MGRVLDYYEKNFAFGVEWLRQNRKEAAKVWPKVVKYIETGKPDILVSIASAKKRDDMDLFHRLKEPLADVEAFEDEDRRVLHVLAAAGQLDQIGNWLDRQLSEEGPDQDRFGPVCVEVEAQGVTPGELLVHVGNVADGGRPNSAGRALLALPDDDLAHSLRWCPTGSEEEKKLELLFARVPERVPPVLERVFETGTAWSGLYDLALKTDPARYTDMVLAGLDKIRDQSVKFNVAKALYDVDPVRFRAVALEVSRDHFRAGFSHGGARWPVEWMARAFGTDILEALTEYITRPRKFFQGYDKPGGHPYEWEAIHSAVEVLGREALPAVLAMLRSVANDSNSSTHALLKFLVDLDDGTHDELIYETLDRELADPMVKDYGKTFFKELELAARWKPERLAERFWDLLGHANKQVRDAVVPMLAPYGGEAVPRAAGLLADSKSVRREAAVALMAAIGTPGALDALQARRDVEKDDRVRDAILNALDAAGRSPTPAEVDARIAQLSDHLKSPVAPWAVEAKLPPLLDRDGKPLGPLVTRFLLWRQKRRSEIVPDVEARPVYDRIDPASGADFAAKLLENYLGTKADAADRFALAVAGRLGDARVVSVLDRLVDESVKSSRGKLAEYAVSALALVRDEATLTALDAVARRYSQKPKNVAEAAAAAIDGAASALGISRDELGDRVAPRLGFKAGEPRVVACGGKRIEVTIGTDFKLAYRDPAQKKPLKSLPPSAPKEAKAELKEVAAQLREAVKTQTRRLEDQMVKQRRWPSARWRELFLDNPVLFPFAVRLVWGAFDDAGALVGTFRALEDRTFTDASDAPFAPPDSGTVGIVHPLELDAAARQSWQTHLADYEVSAPFPQMERPVVRLPDDRRDARRVKDFHGTELSALSFKSRAEKLGWVRGPVMGNGSVEGYYKRFPVGVEAVVGLEMMNVQPFPDQETKLEDVAFVRAGVELSGYSPLRKEADPDLLPLAEVPPIVYSEVMGDLGLIAGRSAGEPDEDGTAREPEE